MEKLLKELVEQANKELNSLSSRGTIPYSEWLEKKFIKEKLGMEWIDVNDKLPEREVDVLFITKEKKMYVGGLCSWETCNSFHYNSTGYEPDEVDDVTHQQPLIEAPKQDC